MSFLKQLKNKLFVTGAFVVGASVGSIGAVKKNAPESVSSVQTATAPQNATKKEALIKAFMATIDKFEGIFLHPYLDTKGNLTIGYGQNIQSAAAFAQVRFQGDANISDTRISLMEKRAKFMNTAANWKTIRQKNGHSTKIFNVTATGQKDIFGSVRITKAEAKRLLKNHLAAILPVLENNLKSQKLDLYALPIMAQVVLLDIHYNTGNTAPAKWPALYQALKAGDWEKAARESARKDVQSARNLWAARQMRLAGLTLELNRAGISYEQLPVPTRDVVNYMSAILKNRLTAQKWPKFFDALKKQNYTAAAAECRIRGIPEAKNIWMKERMLEAVAPSTTQTYYLNRTCSR